MKIPIYPGQTSVLLSLCAVNSSSTFGGGLTGFNGTTSGTTGYYFRSDGSGAVSMTLSATGTLGVFNSGCLKEVDQTNLPGVLQLSIPNAALPPLNGTSVIVINNTNLTITPIRAELFSASTANAYQGANVVSIAGSTNSATVLSWIGETTSNLETGIPDNFIKWLWWSLRRFMKSKNTTSLGKLEVYKSDGTTKWTAQDATTSTGGVTDLGTPGAP